MSMLLIAGAKCEALMVERVRNVPVVDVQADEIWSYVGKKEGHEGHDDTYRVGDAWTFIAIERGSKLILAYEVGKRTVSSATRFINKLADATDASRKFQLTTDGLKAYLYPVGMILDERVNYAQLVKIYHQDTPKPTVATAPQGSQRRSQPQSMETQTRSASARPTSSARTDLSGNGANGSRV